MNSVHVHVIPQDSNFRRNEKVLQKFMSA